jgi:hypothetical protein
MARFHCPNCKHEQEASERKLGKQVVCPKCGQASTFAEGNIGMRLKAELAENRTSITRRLMPISTAVALALLAWSLVLQSRILKELQIQRQLAQDPMEVIVTEPVSIETSYGETIGVEINGIAYGTTIPVEIESITTTRQLPVNVESHSLYGGLPIPVAIE